MIEHTIENLNKASQIILKALFEKSELSESGGSVKGFIHPDEMFLLLINLFYPEVKTEEKSWGDLMQGGYIENCENVEKFTESLVSLLVGEGIIRREYSWSDISEYTMKGYKTFLKSKTKGDDLIIFTESTEENDDIKNVSVSKKIKLQSDRETLKQDLLNEIDTFNNLFKRKIHLGELFMRFLSTLDSDIKKYSSIYELEKSNIYEEESINNVTNIIEEVITECYRDDLVNLNQRYISLTKIGEKFLHSEDNAEVRKTIEEEKVKSYLTTQIIHISDLHFGSSENIHVDNKDKLESVTKFKDSNFDSFKTAIKDIVNENTFLVISGDITSKNETQGFEDCITKLKELEIKHENIYLIPGNHDVSRSETNEKLRFSNFITFFTEYSSCFSKPRYLINHEEKLIVYGFNTVHHEDNEELFFLHNKDIEQFTNDFNDLSSKHENVNQYTKIAVIHNNIIPHPNVEVKKYSEMFNLFKFKYELISKGFSIVLSGHKHQPIIEKQNIIIDDFKGEILVMSAGALSGLTANVKNSFQIIDLKRDSDSLRLHKAVVNIYEMTSLNEFKQKYNHSIAFE